MVKVKMRNASKFIEHERATTIQVHSGVLFVLEHSGSNVVAVYNAEEWANAEVEE